MPKQTVTYEFSPGDVVWVVKAHDHKNTYVVRRVRAISIVQKVGGIHCVYGNGLIDTGCVDIANIFATRVEAEARCAELNEEE